MTQSRGEQEHPTDNKRMKATWTVRIMLRKCILNNAIEGKKEGRKDISKGKTRKKV
jgi:hypothetical protein